MALWYYNPDPSKITFRREYLKTDAYLYLPGPSLAMVDFDVRIEGTTAFAINTAYPKVKPNIWLGMDKPECYDARLLWESFPKIFRGSYWKLDYRDMHLRDYPQVYFADIEKPEKGIRDMFLLNKDEIYFAWFNHSLGAILHVMLWMGAKKIHFVGCDLGGNRDYWDDRKLSDDQRIYNQTLYKQQECFLEEFTRMGKEFGVECVSCTDGSPINKFMPYLDLKMALEDSKKKVGDIDKVKHALDTDENMALAKKIVWNPPIRERGVMVMCDKDQEWLLDWWYNNYTDHNHLPIQFVDIGMSESAARYCKARGSYTKMPELHLQNWFKKPFALKMTQFKRTLFMDLDVEVRGSVFELFEDYKGFCVAKDIQTNFTTVKDPVNSGVVLYTYGDMIVDRWAEKVLNNHTLYHGDQDCLDNIEKNYTVLPQIYNWLRLQGESEAAMLYHYTGPLGKEIIKKMIKEG